MIPASMRKPGLGRAGWFTLYGIAFAYALTIGIRTLYGHDRYDHFLQGEAVLTVALLAAPLFFLVGLAAAVLAMTRSSES